MSEQDQQGRVRDMLQSCRDTQEYSAGLTQEYFLATKVVYQAVLWNLTVLGEAASHSPESTIVAQLEIPWAAIIGMRHRLVHGYGSIDPLIVWDVVQSAVPTLIPQSEAMLEVVTPKGSDA